MNLQKTILTIISMLLTGQVVAVSFEQLQAYTPEREAIAKQFETNARTASDVDFQKLNLSPIETELQSLMKKLNLANLTPDQKAIWANLQKWFHQLHLTIQNIQKELALVAPRSPQSRDLLTSFKRVSTHIKNDITQNTFKDPSGRKLQSRALKPMFKSIMKIEEECINIITKNIEIALFLMK